MHSSDKSEKVFTTESSGAAADQNFGSILANQNSEEFQKLMAEIHDVENTFIPAAEEDGLPKPKPTEEPKPDLKAIDMDIDDGPALVPPAESKLATVALSTKPHEKPAPTPADDEVPLPNVVPDVDLSTIEPFTFPDTPSQDIEIPTDTLFPDAPTAEYPVAMAAAHAVETETPPVPAETPERQRSDRSHHEPRHSDALHADTSFSNHFEEARRSSLWKRLTNRRKRSELVQERAEEIARERGSIPVEDALLAQKKTEAETPQQVEQPESTVTEKTPPQELVSKEREPTKEQLIETTPQLYGLQLLGQEIYALETAHDTSDDTKAKLESKHQLFADLYELYTQTGLNKEALTSIVRTTIHRAKPAHEVHAPRTTVKPAITEPRIKPEAEPRTVFSEEKQPSKIDRIKKWFKKETALYQEYGGVAWLGNRWNQIGDWLVFRGVTDTMTEAEIEAQKGVNRRNNAIGIGVLAAVCFKEAFDFNSSLVLTTADALSLPDVQTDQVLGAVQGAEVGGLFDAAPVSPSEQPIHTPSALPSVEAADLEPQVPETPEAPQNFQSHAEELVPETDISEVSVENTIENPAFNIPEGGTGIGMFEGLGLDADIWNANAHVLLDTFPGDFYSENGDVRIARSGWLSADARQFILDLKWGIRG